MLKVRDSFLIFIALLLTTKYMIFSVTETSTFFVLLASVLLVVLFARKAFVLRKGTLTEQLGLVTFILAFILFNVSKFFGELTVANAIIPTGMVLILMVMVPFFCDRKTLKQSLLLYSKFNSLLLLMGLFIFLLSLIGLVHSNVLVHASDHANTQGYVSLYGLAYYPSWFKISLSGIGYYRFTGAFWEPGTLGLYLVVLVTIELSLFYYEDSRSRYRLAIYLAAGIASLSMLFIGAMSLLLLMGAFLRINNKKFLTFIFVFLIFLLFVFIEYYDYIYKLLLYRLDFDSQRGFVGNNRSGVFSAFVDQFSHLNVLQQLIGAGPYVEFEGDPTSFVIKIIQRGVLGFTLLMISFMMFCIDRKNKYIIPAWIFSLAILCQFEGAIFLLMLSTLVVNKKNKPECIS